MTTNVEREPRLAPGLLASVLARLEIPHPPNRDLAGLNRVVAAYVSRVANDNIQKRIWLAGDKTRPVTGGDPHEFLANWLEHGTGGTCFPSNGALCTLLQTIGFEARRFRGSVLLDGIEQDGNHGTVIVSLAGVDHLVDAQLAAFRALPLVPGKPASTGDTIHDIRALPTPSGFDVEWFPGSNRTEPLVMRPDLARGAVDHADFVAAYALSALRDRRRSPFNDAAFAARRFDHAIVVVSRGYRTEVSWNGSVARRPVTVAERSRILVEEFGFSEAIVAALPPDDAGS